MRRKLDKYYTSICNSDLSSLRRNPFIVPIFNHQYKFLNSSHQYDYIIAGAGCAGLSLLMYMIESEKFSDKRILVVDKEDKNKNDRTWCFWEKEDGFFEEIVYKKWTQLWFHDSEFSRLLAIQPYQYKMIRGIDFYKYCFDKIKTQANVDWLFGNVQLIKTNNQSATLTVDDNSYEAKYIFNSILFEKPQLKRKEYYLLQHFKGWVIEADNNSFDPNEATLMDFRLSQQYGTTFIYVMPFSEKKALVEYTLFSSSLLDPTVYETGLKEYIARYLKINKYQLKEEEFGVIPMTNHRFHSNDDRIINIGTAGGQTKGSSGYTFRFIQRHSKAIVDKLIKSEKPVFKGSSSRFRFYDSVLLNIFHNKTIAGKTIFSDLFKKNKPQTILRFLDNESSFTEDLKIISSLPTFPFLKAALKQI